MDRFRHRASTYFAMEDVPAEKRETFYRHMGHTEFINKSVYQCPLAITEITTVGQFMTKLNDDNASAALPSGSTTTEQVPAVFQGESQVEDHQQEDFAQEISEQEDHQQQAPQQDHVLNANDQSPMELQQSMKIAKSKRRPYVRWNDADSEKVKTHFRMFIENVAAGATGALPSTVSLRSFLHDNSILSDMGLGKDDLLRLLRTKVFNERKRYRERAQAFDCL